MSNDLKRLEELEQQYRMQCGVIDTYEKECDMLRANLSKAMADMGEVIDEVKRLREQLDRAMELVGGCPKDKGLRCSGADTKKCGPCITGYIMEGE